jgi:hypothetical protein
MARPTKQTLQCECVLTDAEKLAYAKIMSDAVGAKQTKENELKTFSTQAKAEIQNCDSQIALYSNKIQTGKEYRPIVCSITYDWDKKVKQWFRTDTGEFLKDDIISEHELQEEAELNAPSKE